MWYARDLGRLSERSSTRGTLRDCRHCFCCDNTRDGSRLSFAGRNKVFFVRLFKIGRMPDTPMEGMWKSKIEKNLCAKYDSIVFKSFNGYLILSHLLVTQPHIPEPDFQFRSPDENPDQLLQSTGRYLLYMVLQQSYRKK